MLPGIWAVFLCLREELMMRTKGRVRPRYAWVKNFETGGGGKNIYFHFFRLGNAFFSNAITINFKIFPNQSGICNLLSKYSKKDYGER